MQLDIRKCYQITYVGAKVTAERAGVMFPKPLNVERAEDLSFCLRRALAQLQVLSLVLAADVLAADPFHRLTEPDYARLLRRLCRDLLVAPGALADEGLQRSFG